MEPTLLTFDIPNVGKPGTHRLTCYEWGDPHAARTVLCVHGLTRNGRDFDFLAQALAVHYRVLCPDMPGRGKSEWLANPAAYSYPTYIADLHFMLQKLHIRQVDWVGTSMGGIIAMMMAASKPKLLRSLVLNDVGCLIPAAGLKRILSYAGLRTAFATRTEAEATLRERCAPFGIPSEAHWQHMFHHSIEALPDGTFRLAYDPAIAAGFPKADAISDINLWPFWKPLTKIPVLLIRGASSDILTHATAMEMKMRHADLSLQEIPRIGHAPALMEHSQITLIADWLRYRVQQKTHDNSLFRKLYMRFLEKMRKI
jgi:pimeloyl-ACP methyl ester carboxylesterase